MNIVPGAGTIAAKQDSRVTSFIQLIKQGIAAFTDRVLIIDDIYLDDCEFVDIRYWSESLEQYCRASSSVTFAVPQRMVSDRPTVIG